MDAYNNAIDQINNDFHSLKEQIKGDTLEISRLSGLLLKTREENRKLKAKLEASEKMNELYARIIDATSGEEC